MTLNVTKFFQVQQSIKLAHWVTDDYSLHVLLDDFYKDYSALVDEIVENFMSVETYALEVLPFKPNADSFMEVKSLIKLATISFDEVKQNIDKMPKGMRTIIDEVDKFLAKYRYLFEKF